MSHGGWRTGVVWKVVAGSAALALTSVVLSLVQPVAAGSGWELLAFARIYVTAVVDRQDPNTLHAIIGTDTQMVSNDRGQTWRTVPSDLRPFYVQDPKRPQTYFRCGRAPTPPGITRVERSTDDGQTWSPSWSPTGQVSRCGVTGPGVGVGMPSILFAWALINAGSGQEAAPLMRSTDGGESWSEAQFPAKSTYYSRNFVAATFDVVGGTSFLAAASDYYKCGSDLCIKPPVLWKSTDYFQNDFTELTLPTSAANITAMAFTQGQLLLVSRKEPLTQSISEIWQSSDDGRTWFLIFPSRSSVFVSSIAVWPGTPTRILLGTSDGLYVRDLPTIQRSYLPLVATGFVAGW